MVAWRLVRHWMSTHACELTILGSGPESPAEGADYVRLPAGGSYDPVKLSEFEYARFCRDFEAETTRWLLERRGRFDPSRTCVLVNDVAEGPTLDKLAAAGYPIVSLWHVDVVDYINKIYLRSLVAPERLTRLYERCRRLGISGAAPDLVRVIFEKQSETVAFSRRLIVPSRSMAETLDRCYGSLACGQGLSSRLQVVPWGAFEEDPAAVDPSGADQLRSRYGIGPKTQVLMTLSRISPEKGLHILLEALRLREQASASGEDLALLICGEAAFMQGEAYNRRVRAAAGRLKRTRVFFPGYLDAPAKQAHFALAHLFVSPSIHESYGLTVAEAMRAGLAVLASDHYGVREMLDEDCGRVVSYGRLAHAPQRLAEALSGLLRERGRLAGMGRCARERIAAMPFSRAADAVLATCQEVVG